MKCGEKWGRNHKCPEKVALHVLEEVMEAVQPDTTTEEVSDTTTEDSSDEEQVFALSNFVAAEVQGKKTIKLTGLVNNQQILIIIDSGSSCTFISEKAVDTLRLAVTKVPSVSVTVANGDTVCSDAQVSDFTWWSQGHTFTHSARVLKLSYFDMVLGVDWLEQFSPMWIHWKRKLLQFTHRGKWITLKGIKDCISNCSKVKVRKLRGLIRKGGVAQLVHLCPIMPESPPTVLSPAVQQILDTNEHLFKEPDTLPPSRKCDHHIPLILGVKPVNVKPYRYSPTQKDEIE